MASYILHRITSSTMSVPQQKKWISYPIKQCELSKWITLKWHFYECSSISNFGVGIKRKGSNFAVCKRVYIYISPAHTHTHTRETIFCYYLLYCIIGCLIVVAWSPKSQIHPSLFLVLWLSVKGFICIIQPPDSFIPLWFILPVY